MNRKNKLILQFGIAMLAIASNSEAARLDLTSEPLFLDQKVPPAIVVTFDDSGSMQWGIMVDSDYPWPDYDRASSSSSDFNRLYYNPSLVYSPPAKADGTTLPDSNYNSAQVDGYYRGGDTTTTLGEEIDLRDEYRPVRTLNGNQLTGTGWVNTMDGERPANGEGFYHTWNGPSNATPTVRRNAAVSLSSTDPNRYFKHRMNSESLASRTNFANWYTYYNTRNKLTKGAMSRAFMRFDATFKVDWQTINNLFVDTTGSEMSLFESTQRENFYDWLYRVPTSGGTPLRSAVQRAGTLFQSDGVDGAYYDANYNQELACQQNFHIMLSDGGWNGGVGTITANIDNTDDVFPDGTQYPDDIPSDGFNFYAGTQNRMLADNTFFYWKEDLRTDLPDNVPSYIEDYKDFDGAEIVVPPGVDWKTVPGLYWNPNNDPATWQHMVNFNVGLGVEGSIENIEEQLPYMREGRMVVDFDSVPYETESFSWTNDVIDDVWHASLNSRGKFFSAKDPNELATSLEKIVKNIIARKGRASAGSVSSNVSSGSSLFYKVGFDMGSFSGSLEARRINEDGSVGSSLWFAEDKLDSVQYSDRKIITYDPDNTATNKTVNFDLSNLSSDYIKDLKEPFFVADTVLATGASLGTVLQYIIDYIKGDDSNEGTLFRNRQTVLGDMIFATPVVVRGPSATYDDDNWQPGTPEDSASFKYNDYRMAYRDRDNIILAGANDGMMHAFGAGIKNTSTGGEELWAYIPREVVKNIAKLADPDYLHTSYVDGSPYVKDVFINNNWTTVALGGLRKGGKAFYALNLGSNLTNTPTALWEFDGDNDMGYTYSGGVISRVYDPDSGDAKWVAFLPNGYDSDTNRSAMYAVDMEDGALLHKWVTGIGNSTDPNGMGPPVVSDFMYYTDPSNPSSITFGQSDQSADYVYAGDLHGNLYRFNALDVFSPGTTNADILFDGSKDQPITTAPRIFTANDSDASIVITFGTGKYIEPKDRDTRNTPLQYIVGIRDKYGTISTWNGLGDSRLVEQEIASQSIDSTTQKGSRTISDNTVNSNQGWKLSLKNPNLAGGDPNGERMVNAMLRDNQNKILTFVTTVPIGLDPCSPGGQSWIMAIDPVSGARLQEGYFDGNADGTYVENMVLGMSLTTNLGGSQSNLIIDLGGSGGVTTVEIPQKSWGRRSW